MDNNGVNESTKDEVLIRVKEEIQLNDTLEYDNALIIYQPTGQINAADSGSFRYCPSGHSELNRGIEVSNRGRPYTTTDTDDDGKDEFRNNAEISC